MLIDPKACIGCENCAPHCPVEAIYATEQKTRKGTRIRAIDLDLCVECGTCLRADVCNVEAIYQQPLEWPRIVRGSFSNPLRPHSHTGLLGRGTEEMKTNEVTHRYVRGQVGVAVEMGRPGVGTSLRDIERLTRAMARHGVEFEPNTPVTGLMSDPVRGVLKEDVLNERVLSAIIEFKLPEERLAVILPALKQVAGILDTVFSLGVISALPPEGPDPVAGRIKSLGFDLRPNGKVNLGLGRPLPKK
ncbi:MAG TPA: 4Fe-4S dicluster domain-containing protein [Candidatus Methylomirabilis sp.]|nr:4Fe-4S dicluster domain-containing protein [Candidatus Methylomirabilis sp.]